jgi:hypothetical protein
MTIVEHIREKSTSRNSARTLLLDLAIYANDCCGVAWPADATLRQDTHVSHQRVHELKNALEDDGELAIVERPGSTNLYFVAWQGKPLGGTSKDDGRHEPRCPLRHLAVAQRCARQWPDRFQAPPRGEGSEIPDTPPTTEGSEGSDPQGSEISEGRGQETLTQKLEKSILKTPPRLRRSRDLSQDKPERRNPFWCDAHGVAHSARLPDHRPDCWLEAWQDPDDIPPPRVRLTPSADNSLSPIAQVLDTHLSTGGLTL